MSTLRSALLTTAITLGAVATAEAQTATQTVGFEVQAINQMSVSGTPSLTISTATAGSGPTSVSAAGTYAVTSNQTNRKITAEIDQAMPADVSLTVALGAPTGATSAGTVTLSATAADVVTGVSEVAQSGLAISYGLSATVGAGVVSSASRTVTYTITAGA